MKKETCQHCNGSGEIEICERCNNTGFISLSADFLHENSHIPGYYNGISSKRCDNPDCKITITVTN